MLNAFVFVLSVDIFILSAKWTCLFIVIPEPSTLNEIQSSPYDATLISLKKGIIWHEYE